MPKLEPPDIFFLSAAVGWMELGDAAEAGAELEKISAPNQRQADVLEVRWMLLAQAGRWDDALEITQALVQAAPNRSSSWLHRAYALRRAANGGLQQAWDALLPAHEKFPREATIAFNLSCYACQLQQLEEARSWFHRALKLGGKNEIKAMALGDPDLEPLWVEIREL
jgi:tetratricopeptide (TPR) repeat protein